MKVLMLGWEFPPFISGGLGTACYGLTRAMSCLDVEIIFVLPKVVDSAYTTHVKLLSPTPIDAEPAVAQGRRAAVTLRHIDSPLKPYCTVSSYEKHIEQIHAWNQDFAGGREHDTGFGGDYAGDMYSEVQRYADLVTELASGEQFDLIHAHDWMTYPAAMAAADMSGKPLVAHIHSTEFDRSGENVNQAIYDIERAGFYRADRIIAVSHFTRNIVLNRYAVTGDKVEVAHNGVDNNGGLFAASCSAATAKTVLFLGRITMQKGPEYFLMAAKKVLEVLGDVRFIMVGSGDMLNRSIELAAGLGIGGRVSFTGFLRGRQVEDIYRMADLCVMPSVSEPFGIVPLEALCNDIPVIISKQSGVSEVIRHALKVDFWDVDEMANKIIGVLRHRPLQVTLRNYGNCEARKLRWADTARKCVQVYRQVLAGS